jgi:WD40 repeat protein
MTAAFTPDGRWLLAEGKGAEIQVWDRARRQRVSTFRGHIARVTSLAVSPDGRTLASADNNGLIKLWRLERGRQGHLGARELLTLRQHQDSVGNLQFSPDGSILASASADGTVRLWRAK